MIDIVEIRVLRMLCLQIEHIITIVLIVGKGNQRMIMGALILFKSVFLYSQTDLFLVIVTILRPAKFPIRPLDVEDQLTYSLWQDIGGTCNDDHLLLCG